MLSDWVERLRPFSEVFHRADRQVFLVGGALRNRLLGRNADDFDFATDATPQEVMKLFRRVIPTGLQHGTVTVLLNGESFEVTTFRVDGLYVDHRRPNEVSFTSNLQEDLGRRDFTINALALDLKSGELIDLFGGKDDLQRKVLRAIGVPSQRFQEDALRILRLFRFSAQLGFSIEPASLTAAVLLRDSVNLVSRERVRDEWLKLWGSDHVGEVWPLMEQHGFVGMLARPLSPRVCPPAVLRSWAGLKTLQRVSVWLAACCGQGPQEQFLRELKLSNQEITEVLAPLEVLKQLVSAEPVLVRAKRLANQWGGRERIAGARAVLSALVESGVAIDPERLSDALEKVRLSTDPLLLRDLAVTGADLLRAGVAPGPQVGIHLHGLLALVWSDPTLNDRSVLLDRIR